MSEVAEKKKNELTWASTPRTVKIFIILVILLILTWAGSWIYRLFKRPANASYIHGGGEVPEGWEPDAIAKEMFDACDDFFVLADTKNDAAKRIVELNDNQIIKLYNYWNEKYATKSAAFGIGMFGTLTAAMKAEENVPAFGTGVNYWDALLLRLDNLKLP